jgi:uncharacterized phage protein (TIGR01671 family)
MREIKFRAWDGNSKEMYGEVGVIHPNHSTQFQSRKGQWSFRPDQIDLVLMQYTGLKDKNGVEIYEGDIVALKVSAGEYKWTVKWNKYINGYGEDLSEDYVEIIGNIFETPELLNNDNIA